MLRHFGIGSVAGNAFTSKQFAFRRVARAVMEGVSPTPEIVPDSWCFRIGRFRIGTEGDVTKGRLRASLGKECRRFLTLATVSIGTVVPGGAPRPLLARVSLFQNGESAAGNRTKEGKVWERFAWIRGWPGRSGGSRLRGSAPPGRFSVREIGSSG